jgi:aerobic-type carbon monoxide dehydrogenase small subunit (CoxS/CutS family)
VSGEHLPGVGHAVDRSGLTVTLAEAPWANAYASVTPPVPQQGWSRRDFIKGVIASGVTVSGLSYFGAGCTAQLPAQTVGGVERLISLRVNGQVRRVDVLPAETLAMTLRYKLGLTGTKLGCDRAECGACTVLVDGVAHYSCSTLTHRVRDREVTTIEGLEGPNGELHPVQQAFIDELAPQCGFCTPGQVMSAVALLRRNPSPTREEARQAMAGNLCRCGAYHHYLNGVMRAAGSPAVASDRREA